MQTQVILLFLSKGYFKSSNCLREVRGALSMQKPLTLVHDGDKAHMTLEAIKREECPVDMQTAVFDNRNVIEWHRLHAFQMVSLKLLAEQLLLGSSAAGPKGFTSDADADHPAVKRVMGAGPWAWAGITPMAFLGGGRLHSPWGPGTYAPVAGTTDSLYVNFVGSKHRVTLDGCYKFHSVRETDGEKVDGWVQMGQQARGSGCPF